MELLETNDPKSLLLKKSAKHKKGLEDEIKLFSENTDKIVTNALIIGGTLALTIFSSANFPNQNPRASPRQRR